MLLIENNIDSGKYCAALKYFEDLPGEDLEHFIIDGDETLKSLYEERLAVEKKLEQCRSDCSKTFSVEASFKHIGKEHFLLELPSSVSVGNEFLMMSKTKTHTRYWTSGIKILATEHDEVTEKIRGRTECLKREHLNNLCLNDSTIDQIIDASAEWDCYLSLALFGRSLGSFSSVPSFISGDAASLKISKMKHPLYVDEPNFVENDVSFSAEDESNLTILTGPNMGGKSTFMKQLASVVILAQIGSLVPALGYRGCIFNKILTRIGTIYSFICFRCRGQYFSRPLYVHGRA